MNQHALSILEFGSVLALVAGRAASDIGRARVMALAPVADIAWLQAEHRRVAAMRALVQDETGWTMEPVPDLTAALARLRIEGAPWNAAELLAAATLLRSSRRTQEALRDDRRPGIALAVLAPLAARLVSARKTEDAIERTIADDATVRDDASALLRRVRRDLRAAEGELVKLLERAMERLESHHQVPDMSVTVRNGRYVIPVRREGRVVVGGIVHDTSATGATLFIEPPAAIEFGNRIRELEAEELREVDRILRELTDEIRPLRLELTGALDALAELDTLHARARYAIEFRCHAAELSRAEDGFAIRDGRHPLLLAQKGETVPFDLEMLPAERTLLVSGPNTGGKTVLLKALGLVSAMMQAGIPAPVGPESRVAVFDDLFADVGDEQSIEASLSTFSAHLRNLREILRSATPRSLVLVDELGSGTDPLEGAALGGAILEELTRRRTMTVATTHLGALKELAAEVPGIVNASLQFDAVALAPTYRLLKGVPGRSYGLSIARRLDMPEAVLARAEERLPTVERDVNALLAELEKRQDELSAREREQAEMVVDLRARLAKVAEREKRVREREREAEKTARQEARRYLLDARQQIERTIRDLRQAGDEALDEQARAARRRAEELAAAQGAQLDRLEREERNVARKTLVERAPRERTVDDAPVENDLVEVTTLGNRPGRLVEIRDGTGVVAFGAVKMSFPMPALRRSRQRPTPETTVVLRGDLPDEGYVPSEVDLRGMRVDELEDALYRALDAAVRADLKSLRIIHGKGTGALRQRVDEMLRKDTRVTSHRLGLWNEGGTGVTIAELS